LGFIEIKKPIEKEIVMPSKIYMTDSELRKHSRHHTVYAGDPDSAKTDSGNNSRIIKQVFINGVARDVSERTYQILKDQGHADVNRPPRDDD
jgi:hypothetical protein